MILRIFYHRPYQNSYNLPDTYEKMLLIVIAAFKSSKYVHYMSTTDKLYGEDFWPIYIVNANIEIMNTI